MKNRVILGFVLTLLLCSFGYGQSAATILGMDSKPSNKGLDAQALEYFQAIIDEDIETIFKYVHPEAVAVLGSKGVVVEQLKVEFEIMKKEGLEPVSVSIISTVSATDDETPLSAVITHNAVFRTTEGEAEFTGRMKVYTTAGKNYFLYLNNLIIQSFGIDEFDEPEDTATEDPTADLDVVKRGVLNGTEISLPAPKYPAAAKLAKVTGQVVVEVIIDKNGKVISAKAISGHQLLIPAAEKAASEATFTPTRLSGQAVNVSGIILYNFNP